ncbi:MAG: glycosyltransferase, partial [bacterium]|nr:glycosyltransferase [bacterium]
PKSAGRIDRWGYQPSAQDYRRALTEADVMVSTARHEFFGISVVEAIAAGAYPLLPRQLSYPEILGDTAETEPFFYDGTVDDLTAKLRSLAEILSVDGAGRPGPLQTVHEEGGVRACVEARFGWSPVASVMDDALERQH